jgi:putative hydroxymethylpyrimidine transport system substrate-binding protein
MTRRFFRTAISLAAAACLVVPVAAALSACGSSAAPAGAAQTAGRTDVTLIMDWVPWVLDIPVDVAQARHFYADAGLNVKQQVPAGATDVVKFVSTGKAQFGLYYSPDTLAAAEEGAPLVSVAALMSHAPVGVAMAPGETASSPKDLAGKVAGVVMIPSTRASFATMLKTGGVPEGDVKVVDPGYELVAPLLAKKFDAVAVTQFAELVQAEQEAGPLSYLDFRDWGTPDYAFLDVVTSSSMATDQPKTVEAFVTATLRGLQWAAAHPEEAVAIYTARHPELKKDLLLAQWKAAVPSLATAGRHPAGWQDVTSWQALSVWMHDSGQLTKDVPVDGVVSQQFVPAQ